MANGNFIAYLRVSTDGQGIAGLGIEAQRQAVTTFLNGGDWKLIDEYVEVESGKKANRPQLAAALVACKKAKATLVVAKLDRLSRSVAFLSALQEADIEFVACDYPTASKMVIQMLAVFAEHERDMISSRTKAALAAAKARGVVLGGRNLKAVQAAGAAAQRAAAVERAADYLPTIQAIQATGITSRNGIATELNRRNVPTPRGGAWTHTSVGNLLARV
jgi:DNA invertase Pin-like site-specific DNA recombinase